MDEVEPWFVDMDGNPMTLRQWADLFEDFPGRVLAEQEVIKSDGLRTSVITIWAGTRFEDLDVKPFGTAVGDRQSGWREVRQYDTGEAAMDGHAEVVATLVERPSGDQGE